MKFLFLSGHAHLALDPDSDRASGGAELQVALLARELVAAGHEVTLAGADTGQRDGVVWDGITVRTAGRFDTGGVADTLHALPRVYRILREERPDFVVVYGWTTWLYFLCKLRVIAPFRLVFVCALDAEIDGGFRRDAPVRGWVFERGMRLADARLAITEHQAALFRKRGMSCAVTRLLLQKEEPAGSLRRIWNVGQPSRLPSCLEKSRRDACSTSLDLLWVARCHAVKRPHLFLDLAERLPRARCRMICSVQDENLWRSVRERAAGLVNVEFLEAVPYREIQSHFDQARIFVNTSTHEGVPNTFIHSGLGHAAILSLTVNPDGMFDVFRAGICADGDFPRFLAQAKRWLEFPDELQSAQHGATRFVTEWHSNRRNVQAFLDGLPNPLSHS